MNNLINLLLIHNKYHYTQVVYINLICLGAQGRAGVWGCESSAAKCDTLEHQGIQSENNGRLTQSYVTNPKMRAIQYCVNTEQCEPYGVNTEHLNVYPSHIVGIPYIYTTARMVYNIS